LFISFAVAQTPGIPQGGGPCETEDECSLGGLCTSGVCVCDAWFTGPSCALLNLQAPVDSTGGSCGPTFESYYSWGGRALTPQAGGDGKYDVYISFMCNHKTLGSWTTASSSAHFVADTPAGPYSWGAEQCDPSGVCTPSIIPWSHNTVALSDARLPAAASFQIWHVGDGIVPEPVWSPCFNASEVGQRGSARESSEGVSSGVGWSVGSRANPGATAYVTTAPASTGPWTRALNNTGVPINFTGSWTSGLAGNPAPLVSPCRCSHLASSGIFVSAIDVSPPPPPSPRPLPFSPVV
jgi:hypothetical protein